MSDGMISTLSHVSLGTNDLSAAIAFYDRALAPLAISRLETIGQEAAAYGRQYPEFWICLPYNGQPASAGNGAHIGFSAESRESVQEFHKASLKAGAIDNGRPGPRSEYGEHYYGCFVIDPEGNRIEAVFHDLAPGLCSGLFE